MSDVVSWMFYYPHPDSALDALIMTANPFLGHIDNLWTLAKTTEPSFVNSIGGARCMFYIPPPCSLAAEIGLRGTVIWPKGLELQRSAISSLLCCLLAWCMSLSSPKSFGGLDDVGDINFLALRKREKGIKLFRKSSFPRPSAGVSSFGGVERVVQDFKDTFHAGRPAGNFGPPVSLFNRHLGLFDYRLSHLDDDSSSVDLPPSLIQLTHVFMNASANIYRDELTRTAAIKVILEQIFATPLIWGISQARFGIRPGALDCGDTPFFVVEVKNEAGLEGDASLQAALSYAHIATSPLVKVESFYVLLSWVTFFATYTDGPYYNLLYSERLQLGFYAEKNLLRLTRAFAATRRVINDLRAFYNAAPNSDSDSMPIFSPRLYRSDDDIVLAEDEITRQSGIYLATMARTRSANEDTVMSSADPHADAHRRLAAKGFAPVLHACVPVCGGLFMVVMDRVHGELAWDLVRRRPIPYDVYKDIHDAIMMLHSDNLVFGDLRTPNIMVVPDGSGLDTPCYLISTGSGLMRLDILAGITWVLLTVLVIFTVVQLPPTIWPHSSS
ncbi:hypothetical protein BGY98DRAFT_929912 [Russula aff. rugulosa BPL654]|nr:hypothetical protein BGY98DRAFT_929912 [Russula aff. rugulosa BPL654]